MRRARAPLSMLAAALCLGGCSRGPEHEAIEQAASRLFGTPVARVHGPDGFSARLASCAGQTALVVSPNTVVELPLVRGVHTLTGRAALCGPVAPSKFEIVSGTAERRRSVLAFRIDAAARKNRPAEPFAVSFWAEEPGFVQLLTPEIAKNAEQAWLELALESRAATTTGMASAQHDGREAPALPPGPGRRPAAEPLLPNERGGFWLADFGWHAGRSSWGPIEIDRGNGTEAPDDGAPLSLRGQTFARGVGVHAPSVITVHLGRACQRFRARAGVDDAVAPNGSVRFQVQADGDVLWESPVLTGRDPAADVDLEVGERSWLRLSVDDAGDGPEHDWADWAEAELVCQGGER